MPGGTAAVLSRDLQKVFGEGTVAGLTDGQLLERFAGRRDESAFGALVARHGPMVLGVCRQVLGDEHAVEDAFQAAFLVLARKAGSIREREVVGGWLYRVAHRIALQARADAARRRSQERLGSDGRMPERPDGEASRRELGPMLH